MVRRFLVFAIVACIAALPSQASGVLGFDGEDAATVGIYIKDLKSDRVIAEHNSAQAMVPASTMKSLTAATAISILGGDFRFNTPVILKGSRSGDVWRGDILVETCADPTLESEYFEDNLGFCDSVVVNLRRMGITSVTGKIRVVECLKDPCAAP